MRVRAKRFPTRRVRLGSAKTHSQSNLQSDRDRTPMADAPAARASASTNATAAVFHANAPRVTGGCARARRRQQTGSTRLPAVTQRAPAYQPLAHVRSLAITDRALFHVLSLRRLQRAPTRAAASDPGTGSPSAACPTEQPL